jgi:hypothetical protein
MTTKKGESFKDTDQKRYPEELPEPFIKALNEIAEMRVATAPLIKEYKVLGKPLPQILDEMDENIRAAAEAARKAEQAARAAKEVAQLAIKAAEKSEKRAEKARISGTKATEASPLKRVKFLEERLAVIEALLPNEKTIILREISKEDAEKEIRDLFSKGETLYYSDIAEHLRLDLELVVDICNELQRQGEIKVNDNALQSR